MKLLLILIILGLMTAGAYMFFIEDNKFEEEKAKINTIFGCMTTADNIEEFSSKQKLFHDAGIATPERC